MNRSWIKRVVQGTNFFTDFKHHPESWRNSKKLRARHDRRKLKQMLRQDYKNPLKTKGEKNEI